MRLFSKYVADLEALAESILADPAKLSRYKGQVSAALNGGPSRILRQSLPIEKQRKYGSFFTGEPLSRLVKTALTTKPSTGGYVDPACGTGNLLLLASGLLAASEDLDATLEMWGQKLAGYELRPALARAARARLALQAVTAFPRNVGSRQRVRDLFPNIRVANALASDVSIAAGSRILMNPPFFRMNAPEDCPWGSGRVSAAAVFLDQFLEMAPLGTEIVAVLPDVLRSGSLYEKWRQTISSRSTIKSVQLFGQFDNGTDIHVFVTKLIAGPSPSGDNGWWHDSKSTVRTVEDFFEVSVGAVVPFRNKDEGTRVPYIQPKGLLRWGVFVPEDTRGFNGTLVRGPFVVVRRNSRVEDEHRAVATIINTEKAVAVENHLLVLKPRDNKLATCKRLLRALKKMKTDEWLNQRIRCRHLTVGALKDVPWSDK